MLWKPTRLWLPSHNGLLSGRPQRHREITVRLHHEVIRPDIVKLADDGSGMQSLAPCAREKLVDCAEQILIVTLRFRRVSRALYT
jgi:hypothetical protein